MGINNENCDMKNILKKWHLTRFSRAMRHSEKIDQSSSAMVFAPHQDDEVLGCGGLILAKVRAGAQVKIVFLTDGSGSHKELIDSNELVRIRELEAISANAALGLVASDLIFLRIKDGDLSSKASQEEATKGIVALLKMHCPDEVYIPYRHEPHPDHVGAYLSVMNALPYYTRSIRVFEYAVWFWNFWPWVDIQNFGWRNAYRLLKRIIISNYRMIRDFSFVIGIEADLESKISALNNYRSQVERRGNNAQWPILSDVANGEFLTCLLQKQEIFSSEYFEKSLE